MFSIHNQAIAVSLCVLTMMGWGSWANTLKMSGKRKWPFELYYWDYALGMVATCFAIALSLGSHGSTGTDAFSSLAQAGQSALWAAFLAGQLFNLSNILIVIATDLAGIAIAFPVAVGLAVLIGTSVTYLQSPSGQVLPLFSGLALLVVAMIFSGIASHLQTGAKRQRRRGARYNHGPHRRRNSRRDDPFNECRQRPGPSGGLRRPRPVRLLQRSIQSLPD